MENERYHLVGILNDCEVTPGFINPIFSDKNNNLYRGYVDSEEHDEVKCYYTQFSKLSEKNVNRVKLISDCIIKLEDDRDDYGVGDVPICGIELNKGIAYIGRIDNYLNFIEMYKDEIVSSNSNEYQEILLNEIEDEIELISRLVEEAKEQNLLGRSK